MSFNENARLDTSQIESGGGGGRRGGGVVVGGGVGIVGVIIAIIVTLLGGDPSQIPGGTTFDPGQVQGGGAVDTGEFDRCKDGGDANTDTECRVVGTVNSVQAYWQDELPRYGLTYTRSNTVLYSGATQSACGTASNQVGPFYCPLDKKVFIDASFFAILTDQFGSDDGALAQEYVVAHEYGHHIQDILGILGKAQQDAQGAQSGSVRLELMADCLGGMWAKNASQVKDQDGNAFLQQLTEADIRSALSAASAVGDDRIQEKTQGRVNPESWTHGSAASRQKWFTTGYTKGDLNSCDTFAVDTVD